MPEHATIHIIQFNKAKRLATGLLVFMAMVFVMAKILEPQYTYLSFVSVFAEAAMVGALADWFAVTALFRSPLGLPIPHTAIIPRNKDRIGESLSDFLEHNFMTPEIIREELEPLDFSGMMAAWLAQPENSQTISRYIVKGIPVFLRALEDNDVRQFMHSHLLTVIGHTRFAPVLADIVSLLVANKHHQALFDHLIEIAARALESNKSYVRWKIHETSPRWLPKAVDDKLYERLLDAFQGTLNEMREEDSEWRTRFQNATDAFIKELRTSPEYGKKIDAIVLDVFRHPLFRTYIAEIGIDLRQRLESDVLSENSQLIAKLDQMFCVFSNELLHDEIIQAKLNQWIRTTAAEAIVTRRETIADLVARVIRKWDAETVSRKLELHVGKDLQYIRINGTLVGGMVGLVLHMISLQF